jgi:hypothetical protein
MMTAKQEQIKSSCFLLQGESEMANYVFAWNGGKPVQDELHT